MQIPFFLGQPLDFPSRCWRSLEKHPKGQAAARRLGSSPPSGSQHTNSWALGLSAHARARERAWLRPQDPPSRHALPLPTGGGAAGPAGSPRRYVPQAAGMANFAWPVLRPWIRELILGSQTASSPRLGHLLKVLRDSKVPGPSSAPDSPDTGAILLVSDGTYSVQCLMTSEALNSREWRQEREFGFYGKEGRLLVLKVYEVHIHVSEGNEPSEFYLQVDCFTMLPVEEPLEEVTNCNQDSVVQKRLCDCLEDHLSESTSSDAGLTLSQLLDEVQMEQEHWGALVRLAESCLMLKGPCTAPPRTYWAASHCDAKVEAKYTVPDSLLHISEHDQQILSSSRRAQQGAPASPSLVPLEESGTSISLLPALHLATPDLEQEDSSTSPPAICSSPKLLSHSPLCPSCISKSCTLTLLPLGQSPSRHQDTVTRAQKLDFKEVGLTLQNGQPLPTTTAKGAQEPCSVWEPPKRHRDGSAFQYEYEPPCASVCAQVQAARLPPQLVAWALQCLMEPQPESKVTQV
ncbi:adrenocortical dysplasia protein homolog isoform X2 [Perognathus longimembris pacificus]|uniref:adrenocortical dysplasia protein homolog isoform X2 n=1 Tax=Perognathus longimembris pacificus TaxID=214514 RepID=UPI00201963DF|nr:adrenocortical dysplasia protein homolog isoform X2 [Perognathus longimembris pacificus]